jgi:hypothetical protein
MPLRQEIQMREKHWCDQHNKLLHRSSLNIGPIIESKVPGLRGKRWFLQDRFKSLCQISVSPNYVITIHGGVECVEDRMRHPDWYGMIVDLDSDLRVPHYNWGFRVDLSEPLRDSVEGFLFPVLEGPIVRVWKYQGEILISAPGRINAMKYCYPGLEPDQTLGSRFFELGGRLEGLFDHGSEDIVYYFQVAAKETATITQGGSEGVIYLTSRHLWDSNWIPVTPRLPPSIKTLHTLTIAEANEWMGFNDPLRRSGDRIENLKPDGSRVLLQPPGHRWRQKIYGLPGYHQGQRLTELVMGANLSPADFVKHWPVSGSIETREGRMRNMEKVYFMILSPWGTLRSPRTLIPFQSIKEQETVFYLPTGLI